MDARVGRPGLLNAPTRTELPPLPDQARGTPWPTEAWPQAAPGADVAAASLDAGVDRLFAANPNDATGETLALAVVHRGRLVLEQYADGKTADDTFISWSMAKSILHAYVGVLVGSGRLDPEAPAAVPEWAGPGDPRAAITLEQLLRMVDGLDFIEDYVDGENSNVIDMLFQSGKEDVAAYVARCPAAHPPGTVWNYSSGTSNVVSRIVGAAVAAGGEDMAAFMQRTLFDPLGMRSATARFDAAGTFIGSSFVFATARDFAKFGLLYLRDGVWDGKRLLPSGWVDHARRVTPASNGEYGAHWWLATDGSGVFHASGYQGQYIAVVPDRDLVVVRLGVSTVEQRGDVLRALKSIVEAFPIRSA